MTSGDLSDFPRKASGPLFRIILPRSTKHQDIYLAPSVEIKALMVWGIWSLELLYWVKTKVGRVPLAFDPRVHDRSSSRRTVSVLRMRKDQRNWIWNLLFLAFGVVEAQQKRLFFFFFRAVFLSHEASWCRSRANHTSCWFVQRPWCGRWLLFASVQNCEGISYISLNWAVLSFGQFGFSDPKLGTRWRRNKSKEHQIKPSSVSNWQVVPQEPAIW